MCVMSHTQLCLDSKLSKQQQQQKNIFPALKLILQFIYQPPDIFIYLFFCQCFCCFFGFVVFSEISSESRDFTQTERLPLYLSAELFSSNWNWLFLTCPVSYTLNINFCTCNDQITQGSRFLLFNITISFCTVHSILSYNVYLFFTSLLSVDTGTFICSSLLE